MKALGILLPEFFRNLSMQPSPFDWGWAEDGVLSASLEGNTQIEMG